MILRVCLHELRRVFTLPPAFAVLILTAALYAAFYPQPYLNEALRDVPVALVDQDGTTASREFARRLDASESVVVASLLPDLVNAERTIQARETYGILVIPKDFERDLLHGRPAPVALYADASYFLLYQRVVGAAATVARAMGAEVETARLIGAGVDPALAAAATDPLPLVAIPLFNPQGGYATYLLPAALVLILQQTLLIGTGLLGTLPGAAVPGAGRPSMVLGRLLAYLALEAVILPAYLLGLPYLYGLPRLGAIGTMLTVAVPFVLAVGAFGLCLAELFRKPLTVQLVTAAIGLPFFFLAGFAWPSEAIPAPLQWLARLIPSTSAIEAFVRVNQMGATLFEVRGAFLTLCGLAVFYTGLAMLLTRRKA